VPAPAPQSERRPQVMCRCHRPVPRAPIPVGTPRRGVAGQHGTNARWPSA